MCVCARSTKQSDAKKRFGATYKENCFRGAGDVACASGQVDHKDRLLCLGRRKVEGKKSAREGEGQGKWSKDAQCMDGWW